VAKLIVCFVATSKRYLHLYLRCVLRGCSCQLGSCYFTLRFVTFYHKPSTTTTKPDVHTYRREYLVHVFVANWTSKLRAAKSALNFQCSFMVPEI